MIASIAWLMGRGFCKSTEYQVRADLNALQTKQDHLDTLLNRKDEEFHKKTEQLHVLDKEYTDLLYVNETDAVMLKHLQKERKETIEQLQDLEVYRVKFERLSESYDEHSKKLVELKTLYGQAQEDLKHKSVIITQHEQQLLSKEKYTLKLEQKLAQKKEDFTATIEDKIAIIATLNEEKKTTDSEFQQKFAANKTVISQTESDKQLLQASNKNKQQENEQLKNKLRMLDNSVTTLQQHYQKKEKYNTIVKQKKSVLQTIHKKQVLETSELRKHLGQQLTNKDAIIKQLQQEKAELSLINQQNTVKIDVLNKKINVYWHSTNATNSRISGMLKNSPEK